MQCIRYAIYDREFNTATVEIKWDTKKDINKAKVNLSNIEYNAIDFYDEKSNTLTLKITGDKLFFD